MIRRIVFYLVVLSLTSTTANAFLSKSTSSITNSRSSTSSVIADIQKHKITSTSKKTLLRLSDYPSDYEGDSSSSSSFPWARNKARTDIRYFLTQRSIQSFVYLLNQCREEHTVHYLEVRVLQETNHYHYCICSS